MQEARKNSGLDVADRIALRYLAAEADTAEALGVHAALIADEVLATDFAAGRGRTGPTQRRSPTRAWALTFWLRKALTLPPGAAAGIAGGLSCVRAGAPRRRAPFGSAFEPPRSQAAPWPGADSTSRAEAMPGQTTGQGAPARARR